MARDIWVTSDTHFNHVNILNFKDSVGKPVREFENVQEMNERMIYNWNSLVKPSDIVYHLGDVVFGLNKEDYLNKLVGRLYGRKRLILGNHDDPKHFVGKGLFQKVMMWRKFTEFGLLLTHVPVHESTLSETRFKNTKMKNVHGHIHQNKSPSPDHICVCVEQTDYKPINIEELRSV